MKRITVRVLGGLGNQIYCLAFSLLIKRRFQVQVALDTTSAYVFDSFNRSFCLYSIFEKRLLVKASLLEILIGYYKRLLIKLRIGVGGYIREGINWSIKFEEAKFSKDFIYLEGYWQKIEYSQEVIKEMLDAYVPPVMNHSMKIISQELICGLAGITHIRIMDIVNPTPAVYFNSIEYGNFLKLCGKNYYISDAVGPIDYLEKLGLIKIEASGKNSHLEEFELLRIAQVKCLAESTFSQWAAKLSNQNAQILWQKNTSVII